MSDDEVIGQVVDAHRALGAAGQGDLIWGQIGIRDPDGRGIWTKAAGWGMEEVGADQVMLVSHDGEVLIGDGPRHIEVFIHIELMRRRLDIGAVVHSHAEAATAFASLDTPLRALSHAATPFLDPDVVRFTHTSNLISTPALGTTLADAIGDTPGCLIPGHGLVTAGNDAAQAVLHAVLLDRACSTQLRAHAAGGPRRWTSPEEVAAKRATLWPDTALRAAFAYLVRQAAAASVREPAAPVRDARPPAGGHVTTHEGTRA